MTGCTQAPLFALPAKSFVERSLQQLGPSARVGSCLLWLTITQSIGSPAVLPPFPSLSSWAFHSSFSFDISPSSQGQHSYSRETSKFMQKRNLRRFEKTLREAITSHLHLPTVWTQNSPLFIQTMFVDVYSNLDVVPLFCLPYRACIALPLIYSNPKKYVIITYHITCWNCITNVAVSCHADRWSWVYHLFHRGCH